MLIDKSASFNNLRPAQKLKYALEAVQSAYRWRARFPIYKFVSTPVNIQKVPIAASIKERIYRILRFFD